MSVTGDVRGRFLIVTWNAGGGTMPAIGLGRLLSARGHGVRVLAPSSHHERVRSAGCTWVPFPWVLEFDPTAGRALEDQEAFVIAATTGLTLAETLLDTVERDPPDVVVVDHQLRSASSAAERSGVPSVSLVHTPFAFHGVQDDPEAWGWDFDPVNETRVRLGLEPIARGSVRLNVALQQRCHRALVVMPAEFDARDVSWPGLVHVGPIFEEGDDVRWRHPWPRDDERRLVVVSLSSQYLHQEDALARILTALEPLPTRVLALTGLELDPAEVPAPPNVVVRGYIPHVAAMREAALVVSHGGMGTIMAAFAAAVPLVCMPLGRDQPANARRVEELGAGIALGEEASTDAIRHAVQQALASEALRAGARRMADVVAGYGRGVEAVRELEELLRDESRRGDSNP